VAFPCPRPWSNRGIARCTRLRVLQQRNPAQWPSGSIALSRHLTPQAGHESGDRRALRNSQGFGKSDVCLQSYCPFDSEYPIVFNRYDAASILLMLMIDLKSSMIAIYAFKQGRSHWMH
jgi:hypothetical protein